MVTIQLANGNLDVGSEQAMELEVTAMRFSGGISDAYTNDIDLPKTRNNIRLLECYNLLDSPNQLYGSQIKPAVLTCDGYMLDVHLQVVSVTDDTITICLYEQMLPNDLRDKEIRELIRDDDNSIVVWNGFSRYTRPDIFKYYDYGSQYMSFEAQFHPVYSMNDVISRIATETGYTLPTVDPNLAIMAQNKYLCPQNTRQMMSVQLSTDGTPDMCIIGGQHVVNDLEGYTKGKYQESEIKSVKFNRDCSGTMKVYISWTRKSDAYSNTYQIKMYRNGAFEQEWTITTSTGGQRNGFFFSHAYNVHFDPDDEISFKFESSTTNNPQNKFELFQMVMDFNWTDYVISEDDYGEEMAYGSPYPTLFSYNPNSDSPIAHLFNGVQSTFTVYNHNGNNVVLSFAKTLPERAWSYHGYWCNLSDITVGQLLWGLAWYSGNGIRRTQTGLEWVDVNHTKVIEGHITSISPTTEHLGRKNYMRWTGQDNATPVSVIDSEFLSDGHDIVELPFAYVRDGREGMGKIDQYDITIDDDGTTSVQYSEIKGQVIMRFAPNNAHVLVPPTIDYTFGFEHLTSATEVEIETFDDQITDQDYVYLDGRKYMIVSVSADLNEKFSKITALLVPTV